MKWGFYHLYLMCFLKTFVLVLTSAASRTGWGKYASVGNLGIGKHRCCVCDRMVARTRDRDRNWSWLVDARQGLFRLGAEFVCHNDSAGEFPTSRAFVDSFSVPLPSIN